MKLINVRTFVRKLGFTLNFGLPSKLYIKQSAEDCRGKIFHLFIFIETPAEEKHLDDLLLSASIFKLMFQRFLINQNIAQNLN